MIGWYRWGERVASRPLFSPAMSRRSFIAASTTGLAGSSFGAAAFGTSNVAPRKHPAKSTILFFLCGGSSHIDMQDMKPDAPAEYRGEFKPIRTSAPAGWRTATPLRSPVIPVNWCSA